MTLRAVSQPFWGLDLVIDFSSSAVRGKSGAYLELHSVNPPKRLKWLWCGSRGNNTVIFPAQLHTHLMFPTGMGTARESIDVLIIAFVDGGVIFSGTEVERQVITLRNPVTAFTAADTGSSIDVRAQLQCTLPSAQITMTCDGVRVATAPCSKTGTYSLPRPRVNGHFELALCASEVGHHAATTVAVVDDPKNIHKIRLICQGPVQYSTAAIVPPGSSVGVEATAPDRKIDACKDRLLLTRLSVARDASSSSVFTITHRDVQMADWEIPAQRMVSADAEATAATAPPPLRAQPQSVFGNLLSRALRMAESQPAPVAMGIGLKGTAMLLDEGIYAVALALKHGNVFLIGDYALLVVTCKAQQISGSDQRDMRAVDDDPLPSCSAPAAPLMPRGVAISSSGILCTVCQDQPLEMLLRPCKHVCLCARCASHRSMSSCPICRTKISSTEKVYVSTS